MYAIFFCFLRHRIYHTPLCRCEAPRKLRTQSHKRRRKQNPSKAKMLAATCVLLLQPFLDSGSRCRDSMCYLYLLAAIMGIIMDYAELAQQFGYITLFVVSFPLAPLLALANNYVEFRSDAFKLLTQMRRPVPRGAEDIGSWQRVFKIITCIAVITNSALVRNMCVSLTHALRSY